MGPQKIIKYPYIGKSDYVSRPANGKAAISSIPLATHLCASEISLSASSSSSHLRNHQRITIDCTLNSGLHTFLISRVQRNALTYQSRHTAIRLLSLLRISYTIRLDSQPIQSQV